MKDEEEGKAPLVEIVGVSFGFSLSGEWRGTNRYF